jgi:4-hydroxybenzoate polyprenyltransferase
MSLIAVVVIVIVLALIATFAPVEPRFKTLLYWLAVGVVLLYLILLLAGWVVLPEFGTPRRVIVN